MATNTNTITTITTTTWVVSYNIYSRSFKSEAAARRFARSIKGGGCNPTIRRA